MAIAFLAISLVACSMPSGASSSPSTDSNETPIENPPSEEPTKTLTSIAIKTNPTKISYVTNETFQAKGLVLTVTYSDSSTSDVTYSSTNTNFSFTGTDFSTAGNKTVTVTYKQKTATIAITVSAPVESTTKSFTFSSSLFTDGNVNTTNVTDFAGKDVTITIPANTSVNISELLALQDYLNTGADNVKAKSITIDKSNYANVTFASDEVDCLPASKIKQFKDLALDLTVETSNLPTLNISVDHTYTGSNERIANLYGTELDKIIEKYYTNDIGKGKLTYDMNSPSAVEFDAKGHLNGGSMYAANNTFNDTAYELDINAAALMGAPLKNVNVVGTNNTSKTNLSTLSNVRFEADMSGFTLTGNGYGVIDFAGYAPKQTPTAENGKVIIRQIASGKTISVYPVHTLDVSALTSLSGIPDMNVIEVYYGSSAAAEAGFGIANGTLKARYVDGKLDGTYTPAIDEKTYNTTINANNKAWEVSGNTTNHAIPTGSVN